MPVFIKFDPNSINIQTGVVPDATELDVGVVSLGQIKKLFGLQVVTLAFNGAQPLDGDFPYLDITWTTPYVVPYAVFVSNQAASPVSVWEKAGARTATGTRILASDQFNGTAEVEGVLK